MAPQPLSAFAARLAPAVLGFGIAVAGVAPSLAQERSLGQLFEPELSTPTADGARRFLDAARAARAQGECPRAKFAVIVKKDDPLFQESLVRGRRDALLRLLGDQARYFLFETNSEGAADDVKVEYDVARDQEFPKLEVVWDPPPGTKVRAGTRIRARATARDDRNVWQSGIRRIDLIVLPESSNQSFGFHEWPPRPLTCEDVPPARTLEGVYDVPRSPPPVVRLRVRAVDHAGHGTSSGIAEFPTADWAGRFEMVTTIAGRRLEQAEAEIALNHDGRGNLTGTMTGRRERLAYSVGDCSHRTVQPNRFRVSLVGTYTDGRALKVLIKEIEETKLIFETRCPTGVSRGEATFKTGVWPPEALLGTPSPLGEGEVRADGTRHYRLVSETANGGTRWDRDAAAGHELKIALYGAGCRPASRSVHHFF